MTAPTLTTYDDLTPEQMRGRRTMKWAFYDEGVIPAWIAEMDFPLADPIQRALVEAIERSETGYPTGPNVSRLPEACAAWLERSFSWPVEADQVHVLPDILRGIELGIQLFSRSESPVIVPTPAYPPFFEVVRLVGRSIVEVPMARDGERHVFDLDAIDAALQAGAGTVLLCNPHNPLGRVFTRDELLALSEVVERHQARVIADEVHAPLVYPGMSHVPYATVSPAAASHSITLTSASKGWNVPGLKCAQVVLTSTADRAIWERLPRFRTYGASILGILANRVAYEEGGAWREEVVAYLDGNRRLLADLLARHLPAVHYTAPQGTYLAWLDCRALGLDDPAAFFLEHARVGLNDGAAFGAPGVGHVRLNFATSRPILTEMVERMGAAVNTAASTARTTP